MSGTERPARPDGLAWVGVLTAGVLLAVGLGVAGRLPDPVAAHWGPRGRPDGSLPRLVAMVAAPAMIGLAAAAVARRARGRGRGAPPAPALASVGVLLASTHVSILWANLDAPRWPEARRLPPAAPVFGIVLAVAAYAVTSAAVRRRGAPDAAVSPMSRAPAAKGRHWRGGASNPKLALVGVGIGLLVALPALAGAGGPRLLGAAIVLATVVPGLAFSQVAVTVGPGGVRIAYGPLRWPVQRVPIEKVVGAAAVTVHPLGTGWGYRGSLRLFRRSAVVVRGGEALRIDLNDGATFLVTVDGAETAAAVLNGLVRARQGDE